MSQPLAAREPHRLPRYRRAAHESRYLILSLPLAVAGFVLFVGTVSVGASSLVAFLLGLVVLAAGLAGARALGDLERRRLAAAGYPLPPARPFVHPGGRLRWVVARLKDGQGWLDLLFQLLHVPISLASFIVTVTWWVTGAGCVLYPLWAWALPDDGTDLADLLGLTPPVEYGMYVLGGVLMLLAAPWVVRGMVRVHHGWARVTLGASGVSAPEEQGREPHAHRGRDVTAFAPRVGPW